MSNEFYANWNEDGSATALARLTAFNGSGTSTGIVGEGKPIQQADVSAITLKLFDLDGAAPNTPTETETLTVNDVVFDTLQDTEQASFTPDDKGYNFAHTLAASYFPTGNRRYRAEYKVVLADGQQFHGAFEGTARPIRGS